MNIRIFRAFPDPYRQSMTIYADQLMAALQKISPEGSVSDFIPRSIFLKPKPLRYISQYLYYPWCAARAQADINHIVDHVYSHLVHSMDARKTVITFHDAIWLQKRQMIGPQGLNLSGLKKAAAIICDSEASRKALQAHVPKPGGIVEVIPPGIDEIFFQKTLPSSEPRKPYAEIRLLHVGHSGFYKNIEGLLKILALLVKKNKRIMLIKAGEGFTPAQLHRAYALGVKPNLVHCGHMSKTELASLYETSDALVFPSLDEGFGLPVLEAMASGLPVIASNRGSLPEVVGSAGILLEPDRPTDFAAAVLRVLEQPLLRQQMIAEGRRQAKKFKWETTAQSVLKIYQRVHEQYSR